MSVPRVAPSLFDDDGGVLRRGSTDVGLAATPGHDVATRPGRAVVRLACWQRDGSREQARRERGASLRPRWETKTPQRRGKTLGYVGRPRRTSEEGKIRPHPEERIRQYPPRSWCSRDFQRNRYCSKSLGDSFLHSTCSNFEAIVWLTSTASPGDGVACEPQEQQRALV